MNCFHFSVSLGYKTTLLLFWSWELLLWIAFIFQYLWDTKQLCILNPCIKSVVNCFHFSVSLGYKTTLTLVLQYVAELWIAFIFQYLWDTKQQKSICFCKFRRCEVLSFFSIFGIQNNSILQVLNWMPVVNCFHFSVSLGYKTTTKKQHKII